MTKSNLCTYANITGNRNSGRSGNRVCKITPHYMAAHWTGRQCADYFAASDAQTYLYARQELTSRGARIAATRNHSKIILLAIGSDRYVVESSANLRSCNNVEQFTLTHSPALYDFHRAWIERIHAHLETLPADHA